MTALKTSASSGVGRLLGGAVGAAALALALGGAATGCGDGGDNTGGGNPAGGGGSGAGGSGSGAGGGGGGHEPTACKTPATGPTRGAAIALTPNDKRIVSVNRDAGTVTVSSVSYSGATPAITKVAELKVGAEPWQVAIDGCGKRAYVALRKDQQVVAIDDIDGKPTIGDSASVGSEPTSLALTPHNGSLYVANWVDGTLTILDALTLKKTGTVDLNKTLVAAPAKYLGDVTARPALAHPRSLAITNHNKSNDDSEKVYVTEFFGQRTEPEGTNGDFDTTHEGVVYSVGVKSGDATVIPLSPLADDGFKDHNGAATGCYPNQLQGITVNGNFAYVTAICASPKGPLGAFQKQACTSNADCGAFTCNTTVGSCNGACNPLGLNGGDGDCAADLDGATGVCVASGVIATQGACKPVTTDIKATTHPVLMVIDTEADTEVPANGFTNLNKGMVDLYTSRGTMNDGTRRLPLVANEITFIPGSKVGYVTANGADAVFRFTYDDSGAIASVGGDAGKEFINLAPTSFDPDSTAKKGVGPIGLFAAYSSDHKFLFTANDISRNVTAVDLPSQLVAGGTSPAVLQTADLPTDPAGVSKNNGKKFFNTGLGRWSLKGQAWGSCQNCHADGLTDNVTWYFNRGPRQSVSLDGSFTKDGGEQRVFNWTAIFDEVADFENNTRGVSGGVGALVDTPSVPPVPTDRINLADAVRFPPKGAGGLSGSTTDIDENVSMVKDNWKNITDWIKGLRSPRAPTNLTKADITAGAKIFADGNCQGCHGGKQWTISNLFYTPANSATNNPNATLLTTSWSDVAVNAGFPAALFPAATVGNRLMRFGGTKPAAFDQIQCILRPVGTFAVSPPEVGVVELRQDMTTAGQGNETDGEGFNPPSLLGIQTGAPYFHAGNARTLEELFSNTFEAHYDAIKTDQNFLAQDGDVGKLVAYLLSIDNDTKTQTVPAVGPKGGDFCALPPG